LKVSNCPNLVELRSGGPEEKKIVISTCPNLKKLELFYDSPLTELDLSGAPNLEMLQVSDKSKLNSLDLSNNKKLKSLNVEKSGLNKITNIKHLTELKSLNISDTDIDSGLEYLPESVEEFKCNSYGRENAKVKTIQKIYKHFNQDLKKLKESSSTQQWLSENCPENTKCKLLQYSQKLTAL